MRRSVLSDGTTVYVAEEGSPARIRAIVGSTVSTLALLPDVSSPQGMAFHPDGSILLASMSSHIIQKVTTAGSVSTFAGTLSTSGPSDGSGSTALLNQPTDITVDGDGNVYVACYGNTVGYVRKYQPDGAVVGNVVVFPDVDGFSAPTSIDHRDGRLFIAMDRWDVIISVATDGTGREHNAGDPDLTAGAGHDGPALEATFATPWGIRWLGSYLYIVDNGNHRIRSYTCPSLGRPRLRGRHVPNPVRIRGRETGVPPDVPRMRGRQAT